VEEVFEKLIYMYTNPVKDGLVATIDEYPGVSTWSMFLSGKHKRKCPRIRRHMYPTLERQDLTLEQFEAHRAQLESQSTETSILQIHPNAWMEAFGIRDKQVQRDINARLVKEIRQRERGYQKERKAANKSFVGADKLRRQGIDMSYIPKSHGQRMWCICPDKKLRKRFIAFVKQLLVKAKEVLERWKQGDYTIPYPLGLYPPSLPKLAEPMRGFGLEC